MHEWSALTDMSALINKLICMINKYSLQKIAQSRYIKGQCPWWYFCNCFKNCAPELAPILAKLFQLSLDTKCVPSDWKSAHVIDVPKKGSEQDPCSLGNVIALRCLHFLQKTMKIE